MVRWCASSHARLPNPHTPSFPGCLPPPSQRPDQPWSTLSSPHFPELPPVASAHQVASLPSASALAIGQLHSLAVVGDGRVVAFGTDEHGSLGSGTDVVRQRVAQQPRLVEGLPMCRGVAVGWKHSAAVGHDGRLWTWGWSGAAGAGMFQDYGGGAWGVRKGSLGRVGGGAAGVWRLAVGEACWRTWARGVCEGEDGAACCQCVAR